MSRNIKSVTIPQQGLYVLFGFPDKYMGSFFQAGLKCFKLFTNHHQGTNLSFDISFSFSAQIVEVILIDISY